MPASLLTRFLADLATLGFPPDARLALAVSGGPDSLALLFLAAAALPGRIEAATVDHGFRPEAPAEAEGVAALCQSLRVPHAIRSPADLTTAACPGGSLQMRARDLRYALLTAWAEKRGLAWLATAHQLDDQAETVLLRANRGSGVSGLGGIRPARPANGPTLIRPLLGWRRADLALLVTAAGLTAVDDPGNRDPRHDRTGARRLLAETDWLDPTRLAATAAHARDAADALDWMTERLWAERATAEARSLTVAAQDLPRELQRRLLARAVAHLQPADASPVRPDRLADLLARLEQGERGTIGRLMVSPGPPWRFSAAPPRRQGSG